MKIPVWVVVMGGSHGETTVTVHPTKAKGRRMVEHALQHEGIDHWDSEIHHAVVPLRDLTMRELQEAWEYHFDGACLIERHDVEIQPLAVDMAS